MDSCAVEEASLCGGVSSRGECASSSSVRICGTLTGAAAPRVITYECDVGERCELTAGKAQCVRSSACREGQAECVDASRLRTCSGGRWITENCPSGCEASALGASCEVSAAKATFSGRLLYEAKIPEPDFSDWSEQPELFKGVGFLVFALSADGTLFDSTYTGLDAKFELKVPASPGPGDRLVFVAAAQDSEGGLALAIVDPGETGDLEPGVSFASPRIWSWSWDLSRVTAGEDLVITLDMMSGAARLFVSSLVAYAHTYAAYQRLDDPLIVWMGYDTTWTCGACFAPWPTTAFETRFASQVFMPGGEDEGFWSVAVTEHELGHWAMERFGTSPDEGGTHYLDQPTLPGQAWSEGWATWFSSAIRSDPVYYDKQGGGMFWFDIAEREYSAPVVWPLPNPQEGLLQRMGENEVAGILWRIWLQGEDMGKTFFAALASPRMNGATFPRGNTRHLWSFDDQRRIVEVRDTGISTPCLADFLDALVCSGVAPGVIDAATDPDRSFPYDSSSPICQ